MAITTNPMREFVDMCRRLRHGNNIQGMQYLAEYFKVPPDSPEFWQIIAIIITRVNQIKIMIRNIPDIETNISIRACECLDSVANAFRLGGLATQWQHSTTNFIKDSNLDVIFMASGFAKSVYGYTVPSGDEIDEFLIDIETLISWLREHELSERDFVRSALIEGLESFLFQIQHVGWIGWPGPFDALKAIIVAYTALNTDSAYIGENPIYEATVRKVGAFLKVTFERIKFMKDVQDTSEFALKIYGGAQLALAALPHVIKLLPSP